MVAFSLQRSDQAQTPDRVDALIMECVKRGMGVLGESGTAAILYHVEAQFGLGLVEIPHNPLGFVSSMRYMFGVQAKIIVRAIVEEMRLNATCDRRFLRFAGALETSMIRDTHGEANYFAAGNRSENETSSQNHGEGSSRSLRMVNQDGVTGREGGV